MSAAQMVCPYCLSKTQAGRAACPFCGKSFENHNPPEALPFGTVLGGRYTLAQHLNTDGEGILYAAVENTAGLRVTIKEYLPVTLSQGRNEAGEVEPKSGSEVLFKTTRMDFADLYRAIQRITPATGLVAVLDVLEENQTVYAVTEQIQGTPLSEYLSLRASVLPLAEARSLMQPIMEGVAALHKAGLVHRGVCPENILLTEGGVARLCGYATLGLRRAGSELKPQLYDGYSAPEQYKPQEFEGRYTDVYGLAAVFYRLVTGAQPLSAVQRQVRDSLPPASRAESGVPGYVSSILSAAMRLVPAERIQTVPELMGALASPTAADALMGREKKEPSLTLNTRHLLALALGIIAVLAIVVAMLLINRNGHTRPPADSSQPESTSQPQETTVTIPNFVGLPYKSVQNNTEYAAQFLFTLEEDYSSEYEEGEIMEQSPEAGTVVTDEKPVIKLTVSKGAELMEMPNIIGFTRENAEQELNSRGIRFSLLMLANNGEYAANCVVKTDIQPGEKLDLETTIVNVYIAQEPAAPATPAPTAAPTPEPTATPAPSPGPTPAEP